MGSQARKSFDKNIADIDLLVDMYEAAHELIEIQSESGEKLPAGYDVALRSALVLLVTCWEAYIEDIVSEGVEHFANHLSSPHDLPQSLRKSLLRHLSQKGQDAYWDLSGDGWKTVLKSQLKELKGKRDFNFNSPVSSKTKDFIAEALGLEDITICWKFENREPEANCELLDKFVKLRGQIAHRAKLPKKVEVDAVHGSISFFKALVGKTGGRVNTHMKEITGKSLWE